MESTSLFQDSREESLNRYRSCMASWLGTVELGIVFYTQVTSSLVILVLYPSDCQRPIRYSIIRLWLSVMNSVLIFHLVFLIACEILSSGLNDAKSFLSRSYLGINSLFHSFLFIWNLVGTVWLTHDLNECYDGNNYIDFYEGFLMCLVIQAIYYGFLLIFSLCLACIICTTCYGSSQIMKFTTEYDTI
jgi:hypothetical protein